MNERGSPVCWQKGSIVGAEKMKVTGLSKLETDAAAGRRKKKFKMAAAVARGGQNEQGPQGSNPAKFGRDRLRTY